MRIRGYTLIELLAVVVILGICAAAASTGVSRAARRDPIDSAVTTLIALDRRARAESRVLGSLVIRFEADGATMGSPSGVTIGRTTLDPVVHVRCVDGGQRPVDMEIDARGRSADAVVEVSSSLATRRYAVAGLSGEWDEVLP